MNRTDSGRYLGAGETHLFLATKTPGGWDFVIFTAKAVAGSKVSDREVYAATYPTLALCRAVAEAYESLGDRYNPEAYNGHPRHATAVQLACSWPAMK
jgi:hypothetical protein